ncbi:phage holin family protein [Actinomyces bowdenii]|uniref:Phage holin family protein n=1 Tax=Actinomyces bowdenii TaxID=131109 RepID=A0A3P1VEM1_9ACTO|nr:phage holin family protein [Actinomyces bowdenii]MBO3725252.1 phage holin family protein [Actinomyces bowdenii]RRD30893.1 phage holin family protein [Actinomyces bowdenii]
MPQNQPPAPPPAPSARAGSSSPQPSLGELVVRIGDNIVALVRGELRLAKARGMRMAKTMGLGAGLLGAAAVLALYAFGLVLASIVQALSLALPAWAASLIVALVLLIICAILAYLGRRRLLAAKDDVPDPKAGLTQSVEAFKGAVSTGLERGESQ